MKNQEVIKKLIQYIEKIQRHTVAVSGYELFAENETVIEAVVFDLSQMGELVKHLDEEFIAAHSKVPFRPMRSLRNKIVHDYDGIALLKVWEIVSELIPPLLEQLKELELPLTDGYNSGGLMPAG